MVMRSEREFRKSRQPRALRGTEARALTRKYPTLNAIDFAALTAPWRLGVLLKRATRLRAISYRPESKPRKRK